MVPAVPREEPVPNVSAVPLVPLSEPFGTRAEHALRSFGPGCSCGSGRAIKLYSGDSQAKLPRFRNPGTKMCAATFDMEISLEFRRTAPILRLTGEQPKPDHGACEWVGR
jgi:hypothetical protein